MIASRGVQPIALNAVATACGFVLAAADTLQFRQALETKYRVGLRRPPIFSSAVDREGLAQWTQEYLRYRLTGCRHTPALVRVFTQIDGFGVQPPCQPEHTLFPPRDELVAFRRELERKYRDGLRREPTTSAVDTDGDIIWTAEYLRFRINGCGHEQAMPRVMTRIDGGNASWRC